MTGLGLGLGAKTKSKNSLFPGAIVQLDCALPGSAASAGWKDLAGGIHFTPTNATLSNEGQNTAYYTVSGTGKFVAASNPDVLANLHKTTTGNQWTLVITGKTTAQDNDWLFGTFYSSPLQNGIGLRYNGNTTLSLTQYAAGTTKTIASFATLPNSTNFILILSYDKDTDKLRCWVNSYQAAYNGTAGFNANTNAADGLFNLGGYGNTPEYQGDLYGFMALDQFCTPDLAAQIIDYYNVIHPRTYVKEIIVPFYGQSNAARMFTNYSGAGGTAFVTELQSLQSGYTVKAINGATSSAALLEVNDAGSGHFVKTNGTRGNAYDTFKAAVDNLLISRNKVLYIPRIQGEGDAAAGESLADYKAALAIEKSFITADFPCAKMLMPLLGKDTNSTEHAGYRQVRRTQEEFIAENSGYLTAPSYLHQSMADDNHLDQNGYENYAQDLARYINGLIDGNIAGTLGGKITSATFTPGSAVITATITPDGNDVTAFTWDFPYWNVIVNGSFITTSAGTYVSPNVITITANQVLNSGETIELVYGAGTMKDATDAGALIDGGSPALGILPMTRLSVTQI